MEAEGKTFKNPFSNPRTNSKLKKGFDGDVSIDKINVTNENSKKNITYRIVKNEENSSSHKSQILHSLDYFSRASELYSGSHFTDCEEKQKFQNPFSRPWMNNLAPAGGGGGGKGLKGIVAGGITGGVEVCITYPTEYIKTQLQLDSKGTDKKYTGLLDCFKKTVSEKGIFGLYRGLSVLLYGSIPKAAIRFGTFEQLKTLAGGDAAHPNQLLFCGLGAGILEAIFAVTPMETVKVKFINDQRSPNPRFKGFLHGVRLIIKEEGVGGVYKGVFVTILKQGSNQAIRFYVLESLKRLYKGDDPKKPVPRYLIGVFGVIAGIASVFGNNPVDTVKTRMQGLDSKKYKNSWDCVMKIIREEGPLALYKGTAPRLLRVGLDVSLSFMIYDLLMTLINSVWP